MVIHMNCFILLLLLGCFGGFECGNNGTSYVGNGSCGESSSPLENGNNIRRVNSGSDGDCGCMDSGVATVSNDFSRDCNDGIATVSGDPSNWQEYPSIPGRESNYNCES